MTITHRPLEDRFRDLTEPVSGGCLRWTAKLSHNGYGQILIDKKNRRATHLAFFLKHGRWPEGILRHKCDYRWCVEAEHLVEGTQKDNIQDAVQKGRMALGERNGSAKLTAEQVREIRARYRAGGRGGSRSIRGGVTQTALAKEYGVSQPVISQILLGQKWERVA
jgi:hypothetical protein